MDQQTLRDLQAPLKERYRNEPPAAVVTLRARGTLADDLTCNVETARALVQAGLHPATGGTGVAVCSGDKPKSRPMTTGKKIGIVSKIMLRLSIKQPSRI